MERRICEIDGCNSHGRNKGYYKGKTRYDRFCEKHHRMRTKTGGLYYRDLLGIDNSECTVCGWSEAACDRHRRVPALGYTVENVVVLCPNHHRLAHAGKLAL